MKRLVTMALLCALTACTGCESTPGIARVSSMEKPASLSLFKVGDNIILTFPNGTTMNGVVKQVGELRDFDTGKGYIEKSRAYTIHVVRTQEVPGPDGEPIEMQIILEAEVPEFALTLRKRPNEKK